MVKRPTTSRANRPAAFTPGGRYVQNQIVLGKLNRILAAKGVAITFAPDYGFYLTTLPDKRDRLSGFYPTPQGAADHALRPIR